MNTLRLGRMTVAAGAIVVTVLGNGCTANPLPSSTSSARTSGPPTASALPSAPPSHATATAQPLAEGPIEPGRYVIDFVAGTTVTFALPEDATGWAAGGDNFLGVPPFADPQGAMLSVHQVDYVMNDPCDPTDGGRRTAVGIDGLVEAIADIPVATVTDQRDVDFGSVTGKWLALDIDADLADCDLIIYHIATPSILRSVGPGQHLEIWVLDVAGERLVIESSHNPATSEDAKGVLRAVTDSLDVEPRE